MTLIKTKTMCKTEECKKRATYGYEFGIYIACSEHRLSNMIDVKNKMCVICNIKRPSSGVEGGPATHCKDCKTPDMCNITSKKCIKCKKITANFGLEERKPTHCASCKTDNMIDVKHILCLCGSGRANFGLEGDIPTCCSNCKNELMINLYNKKCKCGLSTPNFEFENDKIKICCSKCKDDNMIDLVHKKCMNDNCQTYINPKYDGYCAYCYGNLFQDSPLIRNFKTKERLVVDYIREEYPDYTWKFDKIIDNGCSRRRPDIFLDLGYQVIIIEVDENQHQNYDCSCENKRIMELSQDIEHRPLIFIRFNPDKYYDKNNKNISSCFSITQKTGALKINNNKKWNERLYNLKNQIDYWIENETNKTIEIIQLYYDEN